MAIGFALSSVHEIEEVQSEDALYFELKNIRYKIIIDDMRLAQELIEKIQLIQSRRKAIEPKTKKLPEFYKKV